MILKWLKTIFHVLKISTTEKTYFIENYFQNFLEIFEHHSHLNMGWVDDADGFLRFLWFCLSLLFMYKALKPCLQNFITFLHQCLRGPLGLPSRSASCTHIKNKYLCFFGSQQDDNRKLGNSPAVFTAVGLRGGPLREVLLAGPLTGWGGDVLRASTFAEVFSAGLILCTSGSLSIGFSCLLNAESRV